MNILITGGAGFIGSHTADALLRQGHRVRVLDSLEPPVHRQQTKPSYLPDDIEFVLGDVRDRERLEQALQGVEVVFHLAAYQDYLTDFSKFAAVNDLGTALLYEVIVNKGLPVRKVILGSSQAVYGEGRHRCPQHGIQYPVPRSLEQLTRGEWQVRCPQCSQAMELQPSVETEAHPHNQYAVSKYCQELYALTLGHRFGIPTVALRYSITQGPRQSFSNAYSGVLRIFSLRLLNNLSPLIYEDGQQLRDYVSVWDVVRANLLVMERGEADYQVFNVGGSRWVTVIEYAQLLIHLLGKELPPVLSGEFRFGDTRHAVSNISRLRALGWEPSVSLEQIAQEYLDWVQTQPGIRDYSAEAMRVMRQTGVLRRAS